jgi:endogenous inhibitor of DNA gyrase (YacG/DUF329 family)
MIDLGRWVSGTYRVPGADRDEAEDEAPDSPKSTNEP